MSTGNPTSRWLVTGSVSVGRVYGKEEANTPVYWENVEPSSRSRQGRQGITTKNDQHAYKQSGLEMTE